MYSGPTIAYLGILTCQRPAPITPASLKGQLFTLKWIAGLYGSPIFSLFVYFYLFIYLRNGQLI